MQKHEPLQPPILLGGAAERQVSEQDQVDAQIEHERALAVRALARLEELSRLEMRQRLRNGFALLLAVTPMLMLTFFLAETGKVQPYGLAFIIAGLSAVLVVLGFTTSPWKESSKEIRQFKKNRAAGRSQVK